MTSFSKSVFLKGAAVVGTCAIGIALTACGSSSSSSSGGTSSGGSTDPVSTALQTPGVRTVLLAKQRNDLTIIAPPCPPQGSSQQSSGQPHQRVGTATPGATSPPRSR